VALNHRRLQSVDHRLTPLEPGCRRQPSDARGILSLTRLKSVAFSNGVKNIMTKLKTTTVRNGIYHITQRAPGKELLFLEEGDNLYFLKLLKESSKMFSIDIFCFALLSNHVHILLRIKKTNLSIAMKFLFQSYALYFNNKYQRKGHVFCGRYRSSFCNDDTYLLTVSLYIHLNPFKAGLTRNIFDYKWYSLDPYIKPIATSFLKTNTILYLLDKKLSKARKLYKNLLSDSDKLQYVDILKSSNAISIFSRDFINLIDRYKIFSRRRNNISFSWHELEEKIDKFRNKKRISNQMERKALAYLIKQLLSSGYTIKEISEKLDIHRTTVHRLQIEYENKIK